MNKSLLSVGVMIPAFLLLLSACEKNHAPIIVEMKYSPENGVGGTEFGLSVSVFDEDKDEISYRWTANEGEFTEGVIARSTKWKAPVSLEAKTYTITVTVSDGQDEVSKSIDMPVGKTDSGSVSGTVSFLNISVPIPLAKIEIAGYSATTSITGAFHIPKVPVGEHDLVATKTGYNTVVRKVTVVKNTNTDVDIKMTSPTNSGRVFGTVTGDFSGDPLVDVTVKVLNPDESESNIWTKTNSAGSYELEGVPYGTRKILARWKGENKLTRQIQLSASDFKLDLEISEWLEFTDIRDNRTYHALYINGLYWMTENLAYLPSVNPPSDESYTLRKYYVYDYNGSVLSEAKARTTYQQDGVLYNWEAARLACPSGWRLPADPDFQALEKYLGMSDSELEANGMRNSGNVGKKMKSASGWIHNGNGDNSSGLKVRPGGCRNTEGAFYGSGLQTYFWTQNTYNQSNSWSRYLDNDFNGVYRGAYFRECGYSVRCIKN